MVLSDAYIPSQISEVDQVVRNNRVPLAKEKRLVFKPSTTQPKGGMT